MSYYLKFEHWLTVSLDAWQITWQFEPNLLMTMKVFQNIYFLSCYRLGICVYLNAKMEEDFVFCGYEAWPLVVPTRSQIFSYFFITLSCVEQTNHNKHMRSVGHHKILSPVIQKIVMASSFGDICCSQISGTGG